MPIYTRSDACGRSVRHDRAGASHGEVPRPRRWERRGDRAARLVLRMTKWIAALLLTAACALACISASAQSGPRRDRPVEIVVGASPGGGNDITARIMQKILQDQKLVENAIVVNKPGGGGTISWMYLNQRAGEGNYISLANEPLVTNRMMGVTPLGHTDFTPLALLFHEDMIFVANPEGSVKTTRELFDRLKADYRSVGFAYGSNPGNNSHISIALLGRALGYDPREMKAVVFKSGGDALISLLGAHVEVGVSTIAPAIAHVRSGRLRPLAVASPARKRGELASVPTWRELGADTTYVSWRVVFGPRSLAPGQIAFWEKTLRDMTQTPEWTADLTRNFRVDAFAGSADTRRFLDAEYQRLLPVFIDLGLAKAAR